MTDTPENRDAWNRRADTRPAPAAVVKPLDLSYLLKHAFMAGREASAPAGQSLDAWVNYDPNECAAYPRILAALSPAPVEGLLEALRKVARLHADSEPSRIARAALAAYEARKDG